MKNNNLYINKKELIDNWWLNLGDVTQIRTTNVIGAHPLWKDNPTKALIDIMRRPENFSFTCKLLFNIQLHPYQTNILKMLWEHPFSILIASRGAGKCITGDSIIMLDNKICRINDIINQDAPINTQLDCNYQIFGENNFKTPSYCWNNGITNNIDVTTSQGFSLSGTHNHPIRSCDDKNIIWKELKDCKINDYILIDRTESWISNPINKLEIDESYLLGLLVGDGGYTVRGRISFTTADDELAISVIKYSKKYLGKAFRKVKAKYTYVLWGVELWDKLFQYYGFNSPVCGEKDIPSSILESSKDVARAFLQGLFDTDGCVFSNRGSVGYCAKSSNIVKMVQFLLTRFGIISKIKAKLNKKYNRYYYHLIISGKNARKFYDKIGFRLSRKQKLLSTFQQQITNDNIDKIPSILLKDKLISLRKKYIKTRSRHWFIKHNYITPYYLNKYDLTYDKLKQILDLLLVDGKKLNIEQDPEYQYVKKIYDKNYFFDKINKLKNSNNYTYDFHIPDDHSFISNGIISHNSFLLSLYALLRAIFIPGSKVMFVGSAFRQSKIVFSYCENICNNAPIFKDIFLSRKENKAVHDNDMYRYYLETSTITAIPLGDGQRVRGQRSTCTICDEFNTLNEEVYQEVIEPFSAVSINPIEQVQEHARYEAMLNLGNINQTEFDTMQGSKNYNQQIISGTCGFTFEPLYRSWKKYHDIIMSGGDPQKLEQIFNGDVPVGLNYKDYCIIRLPYNLMPKNYMDEKNISKSKAMTHIGLFNSEYGACFLSDSNGFFKRTLIENCVSGKAKTPIVKKCGEVNFGVSLVGYKGLKYVMGIDPAAESDNFAIVILELWEDHRRIVYTWTTNSASHKIRLKQGLVKENDYYRYCARKVRDLMRLYNIEEIALDAQGGGKAISEILGDPQYLEAGEYALYPIIDLEKPKDTDRLEGLHILNIVQFSNADWVYDANHGLRQDMETRELIFPPCDSLSFGLAHELDKINNRITSSVIDTNGDLKDLTFTRQETAEDCLLEIEELKTELMLIEHTKTPNGRDKWDTPTIKGLNSKKGRLRKDRYSALLLANASGRAMIARVVEQKYDILGGVAHKYNKKTTKRNIEIGDGYSYGFGIKKGKFI